MSSDLTRADMPATLPDPVDEQWWSTERLARTCGVKVPTVRDWISRGEIAASLQGRRWRIRESEVQRFLRGRYGLPDPDKENP